MKSLKPKVAFVTTTMGDFDSGLAAEFEEVREVDEFTKNISRVISKIEPFAEVENFGLVGNETEAVKARDKLAKADCDLLLIMPISFTLDAVVLRLIHNVNMPLVLLNTQVLPTIPPDADHDLTMWNNNVAGIPCLTNVMIKNHIPYKMVSGSMEGPKLYDQIGTLAKAAAVPRLVRNTNFGVIGKVYPGMSCLEVDPATFTGHFGCNLINITYEEVEKEFNAVSENEAKTLADKLTSDYQIDKSMSPGEIHASSQFEAAMKRIVEKHKLGAIAQLCMDLITNPKIGITPCLAYTVLAEMGIPVTDEADLTNALTMIILQQFTDEVLFTEWYMQDFVDDFVMLSHCGMGNRLIADSKGVLVKPQPCFPGSKGCGAAFECVAKPGELTYACMTYVDGRWRMIAGLGESLPMEKRPTNTIQVYFKFKKDGFEATYQQFCKLGGIHHFAVAWGNHMKSLQAACDFLDVDFVSPDL